MLSHKYIRTSFIISLFVALFYPNFYTSSHGSILRGKAGQQD